MESWRDQIENTKEADVDSPSEIVTLYIANTI